MRGIRPGVADAAVTFAPGPQDEIWRLLSDCWEKNAQARPRMTAVLAQIERIWTLDVLE